MRDVLRGNEAGLVRLTHDHDEAADFVEFARHHRIAGFLHQTLVSNGMLGLLPAAARQTLEKWYGDPVQISEDRLEEADRYLRSLS